MDIAERLKQLRVELAVTSEQLAFLEEEAGDASIRALVSETPLADAEAREARRHADAMLRHSVAINSSIAELLIEQDALLDRLMTEMESNP